MCFLHILSTSLGVSCCHHFLLDEEIEAESLRRLAQGHTVSKWQPGVQRHTFLHDAFVTFATTEFKSLFYSFLESTAGLTERSFLSLLHGLCLRVGNPNNSSVRTDRTSELAPGNPGFCMIS